MAKSTISDDPVRDQDKFMLRLPEGMRDRIKLSAERNGRSMNAEIVQALEQMFPPEPTVEEVLEKVHSALTLAKSSFVPYRKPLVDSLEELTERLASGIEFDQFRSKTLPPYYKADFDNRMAAIYRMRRAQKEGVETADLERELSRGLLHRVGRDEMQAAIMRLAEGKRDLAMQILRLRDVKFADADSAFAAIEKDLRDFYEENWGDPEELNLPDD
ncbi:Arc family DNA-binding protein [Rhizobium laguerreae]|uniref:Arc family DNA-binding protein n=1 Tax=Rhizobium laguerreae TaxID=1076926 RepID=UPI001C90981E|nr:Arc family DNA-binding protein [Rhizobium laguerreae]MBY3086082.1 Arc family DNA-binding protein [Rhizobium laguerreae]